MVDVSIIIPSCNEKYIQRTIDDVLVKAEGIIEIIVYLDKFLPDPPLKDDPRVIVLHHLVRCGSRHAINACASIARGKYLMKLDAHCILDKGFDIKLMADCEPDWIVIPRRYNLNHELWQPGKKVVDYLYLSSLKEKPEDAGQNWDVFSRFVLVYAP